MAWTWNIRSPHLTGSSDYVKVRGKSGGCGNVVFMNIKSSPEAGRAGSAVRRRRGLCYHPRPIRRHPRNPMELNPVRQRIADLRGRLDSLSVRMPTTTFSSEARSRPRACARSASFQTSGLSSSRFTSSRRSTLWSKSKIPPERIQPAPEVGDALADGIEFHVGVDLDERSRMIPAPLFTKSKLVVK